MKSRKKLLTAVGAAGLLALAACGGSDGSGATSAPSADTASATTAGTESTDSMASDTTTGDSMASDTTTGDSMASDTTTGDTMAEGEAGAIPDFASWDEVLKGADGATVNFYMWGGSDDLNKQVDEYLGAALKEYNVTLKRVPLTDTADAVNQLLAEKQAGTDTGSIDMVWINGDNFKTLKDAELLYGPFSESIPNAKYVNWKDPAVAYDFGTPVDGYESPWGAAEFVFEYDSGQMDAPPKSFDELQTYIHANPGTFAYPAPPDFTGMSFVKHVFMWKAGDPGIFQKPFDQAKFDEIAPQVWEYLNDIEPDLWRNGETYPDSPATLAEMLANSEVQFAMHYDPNEANRQIEAGTYPPSIRTFVMESGALANRNYIAIPSNAPNKAAAMVAINAILDPTFQLTMADPAKWGWNIPTDVSTWSPEQQQQLAGFDKGEATLSEEELAAAAIPEPDASWVPEMEAGWIAEVLEK